MSNDLPEQVAAYAAKAAEREQAKREQGRAEIERIAPGMLKPLDWLKALYGPAMRLGGVVGSFFHSRRT